MVILQSLEGYVTVCHCLHGGDKLPEMQKAGQKDPTLPRRMVGDRLALIDRLGSISRGKTRVLHCSASKYK